MVANLGKIEWDAGQISNIQRIGFRKGLHKLSFGLGYSDQVRMAHRDFAPRWGYMLSTAVYLQPGQHPFQRPDFVLRTGIPARIRGPQLAEGRRYLPDLDRRLQVPVGIRAAELSLDAPYSARIYLVGYYVEQLYGRLGSTTSCRCGIPKGASDRCSISSASGSTSAAITPSSADVRPRRHEVAAYLVRGRRHRIRYQCVPPARIGDFDLQAVGLSSQQTGGVWWAAAVGLPF